MATRIARPKPKLLRWATGEISKLRSLLFSSGSYRITGSFFAAAYRLDSSRVDYAKARALYENTDDAYKLGAGFAKPIINTTVAFMGVPRFRSQDPEAQAVLDAVSGEHVSLMQRVHRDALRDGDAFVWVTRQEEAERALYPEAQARIRLTLIPPEQVAQIIRDPVTRVAREYILRSQHEWLDSSGNLRRAIITQRISAERRLIQVEGDVPEGLEVGEERNPWGFIPIVHFKNEGDETTEFGRSDLEPIEPFMKAYHDVLLHAIQGSKMHSTPRLKLRLSDIGDWLRANFGIEDPAEFAAKGGSINLEGHELLIFGKEDDADFLEVRSATGDAKVLLQLLFYCIVDTSEMPEFVFGVHTPSSLSSVKEQMPILVRRIARKREHFTEAWQRLARIVLAMTAQAEGRQFSTYATTLEWDEIDPRDAKDVAETLERIVNALRNAMEVGLISQESAVTFLAQYVRTMSDYISDDPEVPGEREKIIRTQLLMARLADGQLLEAEKALLEREGA